MQSSEQIHRYEPFDLLIGARTQAGYPVTVIESPAGDGGATCVLDPEDAELVDALDAVAARDTDRDHLQALGAFLFEELFRDEVADLFRTSLAIVRRENANLRLRLRIEAPEIAALPWEYLQDPGDETPIAAELETALVRYVPLRLPVRPTRVSLPLRILVATASPASFPPIDTTAESEVVREALADSIDQGQVELHVIEHCGSDNVLDTIREVDPHIFHFIGHGFLHDDATFVVFEDDAGGAQLVDSRTLGNFFGASKATRVVVLSACQSATTSSTRPMVGMAPTLLRRQLSAVIAMQQPITVEAASIFNRNFYRSLVAGYPLEAAVSDARKAMYLASEGNLPDWAVPVLFLRAKDGLLFDIEEERNADAPIPPPPPTQPPDVTGFLGREAELTHLREKLTTVGEAVITGMVGVGKTSVAATLARTAWPDRTRVFWHTFHADEDLQVLIWRLAGFLYWHDKKDLWNKLQGAAATEGEPLPPEILFDYLLQVLRNQQFLLCLDDIHFVQSEPILNYFVDRIRELVRDGELAVIVTSRRMPEFIQLADFEPLGGLDLEDTRTLIQARHLPLPEEQIVALHDQTGGNATLLTLAIQAMRQSQKPSQLISDIVKTRDVRLFLMNRINAALSKQQQELMEAVSVFLGNAPSVEAVESVLGPDVEHGAWEALMNLSDHFLLRIGDVEGETVFSEDTIVRSFYYRRIHLNHRREMHRRAGHYFELESDDRLQAARHYELAREYGKSVTLATHNVWQFINRYQTQPLARLLDRFEQHTISAADWVRVNLARGQTNAILGDRAKAREGYQTVLSQVDALPHGPESHELKLRGLRGMGELLYTDAPREALDWLQRGLDSVAGEQAAEVGVDADLEAALHIDIGWAHLQLGNAAEASDAMLHGLDRLSPGPSGLRCTVLNNLVAIYARRFDLDRALAFSTQALEVSRSLQDAWQEQTSLGQLGSLKFQSGDIAGAVVEFERATALAERLSSHTILAALEFNLGLAYANLGETALALERLGKSLRMAQTQGLRDYAMRSHRSLALLQTRLGELEAADANLIAAERLAQESDAPDYQLMIVRAWAELKAAAGNMDEAIAYAERSVELATKLRKRSAVARSKRTLGELLFASGRVDDAVDMLSESLELIGRSDLYQRARIEARLGRALLAQGEQERAFRLIEEARSVFERVGAVHELAALEDLAVFVVDGE